MESQSEPGQAATGSTGKGNGKGASSGSDGGRQGQQDREQSMQGEVMQSGNQSGQRGAVQMRGERGMGRYSRDPFALLDQLTNEMDQLFGSFPFARPSFMRARSRSFDTPTMWAPEIDVREEGNELKICADLPGVSKDQVKVDVEDGMVTIQGERHEERTEGGNEQRVRRIERRYGSFYRTIPLPEGADPEQAKASMKEGVLEVTIPLTQKSQGRRLEVQG